MTINLEKRNCPICRTISTNISEIDPDINPVSNKQIIKDYWDGSFKNNVFFPYFRCKCGLLFNREFPDKTSLNNLYSNREDNVIFGDLTLDIKTKKNYLSQLKDFLPNNENNYKILEIGADNGTFLKLLRNTYKNSKFYAIEPNKNMKNDLEEITKYCFDTIEKINENEKFDLIIGIHVFDHLPNLNSYVQKLNSHLNTDGHIFGVVHNEKSLLAKILKNRWPAYRLQHPHLFNHFSLNNLLQKLKFEKIFIKRTKNFFSVGFLINQLVLAVFKIKINLPNIFSIGLKLGNFSFLYKKK